MQLGIQKRQVSHVPWALVITTLIIAGIGVINLASASRPPHQSVWATQLAYLGVSMVAGFVVTLVDDRFIYQSALPVYVVNILALLFLKKFGHSAKGAQSWIALGPIRIQPAEFMKLGVILMLAKYYHDSYRPQADSYEIKRLIKPVLIAVVPFALVLVQPDLGTAMMISLTSLTVILFGKVSKKVVFAGGLLVLLGSAVIWHDYIRDDTKVENTLIRKRLKPHQNARITGWLNPEADPRGTNYHSVQSKIAVGSGGLWGKGWREGTQSGLYFLPEQHTDFIFSVLAEEQGFASALLLIALYGALLMFALGVAFHARDRFGTFVAVGVAAMLFWQIFENIGMVIGLLPVTGITLPLLSYGGSSLLSVMLGVGLLVNISMRRHIF